VERWKACSSWKTGHNFGADYDKTLMAWHYNFAAPLGRDKNAYDDRFYRMWSYYTPVLRRGVFRARNIELWQVVLSKKGVLGGYRSVR